VWIIERDGSSTSPSPLFLRFDCNLLPFQRPIQKGCGMKLTPLTVLLLASLSPLPQNAAAGPLDTLKSIFLRPIPHHYVHPSHPRPHQNTDKGSPSPSPTPGLSPEGVQPQPQQQINSPDPTRVNNTPTQLNNTFTPNQANNSSGRQGPAPALAPPPLY